MHIGSHLRNATALTFTRYLNSTLSLIGPRAMMHSIVVERLAEPLSQAYARQELQVGHWPLVDIWRDRKRLAATYLRRSRGVWFRYDE